MVLFKKFNVSVIIFALFIVTLFYRLRYLSDVDFTRDEFSVCVDCCHHTSNTDRCAKPKNGVYFNEKNISTCISISLLVSLLPLLEYMMMSKNYCKTDWITSTCSYGCYFKVTNDYQGNQDVTDGIYIVKHITTAAMMLCFFLLFAENYKTLRSEWSLPKAYLRIRCSPLKKVNRHHYHGKYGKLLYFGKIFQIREVKLRFWTVLPFSLNQYSHDIVNDHRTPEELMHYEWARYLSFKTFPQEAPVSPLRLAQAGFYYTGGGQEVKCFACGLTNGSWTQEATAMQVHKRLSPQCAFISNQTNDNVAIHYKEYYLDVMTTAREADEQNNFRTDGASGGLSDMSIGTPITAPTPTTSRDTLPDIKHPSYADEATRLASFAQWTYPDVQDPAILAKAGFFFAGIKDYVRCFFCGVALKNWQREDDPFAEHHRWSPACSFLIMTERRVPNGTTESTQGKQPSETAATAGSINNKHVATSLPVKNTSTPSQDTEHKKADKHNTPGTNNDERRRDRYAVAERSGNADNNNHEKMTDRLSTNHGLQTGHVSTSSHNGTCSNRADSSINLKVSTQFPLENGKETSTIIDARILREQNEHMRQLTRCKVCNQSDADSVFLPCGHLATCKTCALGLKECAICRKPIKGTVHVYFS